MANTKENLLQEFVWLTRRLFQVLASESNDILLDFGINASQRAVLEFLHHREPETLVNMAAAHDVSRQHIQQTVNQLQKSGLVESLANPSHKRSYLVRRTTQGKKLFARIQGMEAALFQRLARDFTGSALKTSNETLRQAIELFHSTQWQELKQSARKQGVQS